MKEVDHGVGRILDTLDKLGLTENTIVYFTSDHGGDWPQLGSKGGWNGVFRGGKSNGALEGGVRVPGLIRWPGVVKEGSVIHHPTSLLDLFPTVVDVLDLPKPSIMDGSSLIPLIQNHKPTPR